MDAEVRTWLYDIQNAISEIDSFFEGAPLSFDNYENDTRTRRAVERNIEIIGEATNRVLQKNPAIRLTNARKIVDARNRIIHAYDKVSNEIIWNIVVHYLPVLREEVVRLLEG